MPIATHTLTGDFSGLIGEVADLRATIHVNTEDGSWVNDDDDVIRLGGAVIYYSKDPQHTGGTFEVSLPTSTGTGLQYEVRASYVDASQQRVGYPSRNPSWSSGWFSMTADANLADKANDSTLRITTTLGDQLAARIDGYQDHGDVSGVLTIDPATGTHVLNATGSLLVTLDTAPNGRIVTLYIVGGATNVTVDGIADLELTDGAFASFVRIRGAWVLASAGASGTPATPDTTPPTAVTDLAVTPGDDGVTATATFSAATDAESTVKYRYRLYATGTTAPAWPTSGSQYNLTGSPVNLTGLTAGEDYTMELQAYSAGGSATADTATFTTPTPAGWNTWDTIDFAAATAGTFASPKDFTTTGGRTLRATSDTQIIVGSGKVKGEFQQQPVELSFPSATPPNAMRVSAPFELVGNNSSYPSKAEIKLTMQTGKVGINAEWNWSSGNSRRLIIGPEYGSGVIYTAGPGFTLSGSSVDGIAATGTLTAEVVGQILSVYIDDALMVSADFTNHTYGGFPCPLIGAFANAQVKNDGAIFGLTWEEYSA